MAHVGRQGLSQPGNNSYRVFPGHRASSLELLEGRNVQFSPAPVELTAMGQKDAPEDDSESISTNQG